MADLREMPSTQHRAKEAAWLDWSETACTALEGFLWSPGVGRGGEPNIFGGPEREVQK